ncbi:MAG: GIY-YIG nuclease family protein [Dysgonamonadaceae bacterium]|jgi:putative endonuclease|nr:GIY-YIG nuclease family protein [Dysgonamonadaceae bacterium]
MKETASIYFMTNNYNNVLYVGVTNNLVRRIAEHKAKIDEGYTYKYNCDKLVYYEEFNLMIDAIAREKQLKNWKREWKNQLVKDFNPEWKDLSEEIGIDNELVDAVKAHYNRYSELVFKQGIAGQARNDGTTKGQAHNDAQSDKAIRKMMENNKL